MTIDTALVAAVIGLVTPFIVALATKLTATWEKTAVAFVTVVLGAVATDLANVGGTIGWKQFISIIVMAGAVAGGSRQWLTGTQVKNLAVITKKIGLEAPLKPAPGTTPGPTPQGTTP